MPAPITAFPIATVPPTADLIGNAPSGSISATNVQAAINQLAGLIPAVGAGTDPLFLTKGLNVTATNAPVGTDPNARYLADFTHNVDVTNYTNPDFTNAGCVQAGIFVDMGQGNFSSLTQSKATFSAYSAFGYFAGSGQKFLYNNRIVSWGMGDTGLTGGNNVTFGGGPIDGDEGQSWQMVSNLAQQNFLTLMTITAVGATAGINTTTTQAITRSRTPQTVNVASSGTAVIGDWVVVDRETPRGGQNMEAVKLTAVGPTSITGIFRCNHNNGCSITPAKRITVDNTYSIGQDRIFINLDAPSYSTGNITAISGGSWTGTGTAFANNMVGGDALNIGAISLDADTYSSSPFDGSGQNGPLRSWYQIISVTNPTTLGVFTTSVAGDGAYHGKGPPPGGSGVAGSYPYRIRPCAKCLFIVNDGAGTLTGEMILETTGATWSVGHHLEQVICPYPDVSGFQDTMSAYTPGGTYRSYLAIRNGGARKFDSVFRVYELGNLTVPGADGVGWESILSIEASCNQVITTKTANCLKGAILLGTTGNNGKIAWDDFINGPYIKNSSTSNTLNIYPFGDSGGTSINGVFSFLQTAAPLSAVLTMQWTGAIWLPRGGGGASDNYLAIDNTTAANVANYQRLMIRMINNGLTGQLEGRFQCEKGGAATAPHLVFGIGTTFDGLRMDALGNTFLGGYFTMATNANDGHLYMPAGDGPPTGVPSGLSLGARVPMYIDRVTSQLWLYIGGTWRQPKTPAGAALVTWQ